MSERDLRERSVLAIRDEFPEVNLDGVRTFCDANGILDSTSRVQGGEKAEQLRVVVEDSEGRTVKSLVVKVRDNALEIVEMYRPPAQGLRDLAEM